MTDITYADTQVRDANTQKVLSILPPIQELSPPVPVIPRPIDNHAKPHTVPLIQQQISETAQPYRPHQPYDGLPSGGSIGSANALRAVQLTRGQQNAQDEAVAQLAYALGFALVGAYDALTNQYSDNSNLLFPRDAIEDASYELGHNIVDLTKDSIDRAKDTIRDIRDNPPDFDIPQIKIPRIERPELPDFKFPEFPDFKFPEFLDKDKPIPKPKIDIPRSIPIPKSLERQLRDLELSQCGTISFGISFVTKRIGEYFDENTRSFQQIEIPSSLEEVVGLYRKWASKQEVDTSGISILAWIESGGATGSVSNINLGNNVTYKAYQGVGNGVRADGSPGILGFPNYFASQSIIEITGLKTKTAINFILDSFTFGGRTPEIYRLDVSNSSHKDCPLGKPPPPPETPPEPPPPDEDCNCMAKCCPDIDYRKIQAFIDEAISKLDLVAAIPISWQIRNEGNRPQLVIQCAEENGVDKSGNKKYKSAKYPISVPHWDGSPGDKISLPSYIKGNYEGIYTLSDNSKVTINAQNEIECKRILNAIKPHIGLLFDF